MRGGDAAAKEAGGGFDRVRRQSDSVDEDDAVEVDGDDGEEAASPRRCEAPGVEAPAALGGRFVSVSLSDASPGSPKRIRAPLEVSGPPSRKPGRYVFLLTFIAALNSANLGYDIGVMSGAALYVQEDMDLSDVQVEVLVGILNGCAIFGAAVAHVLIDALGRRRTFTVSCIIFVTGVFGMASSPTYASLLAFRVITGVGVGVGLSVDPVYIAEVAPKEHRGSLVSWSEIFINVGILLGFIATFVFKDLRPATAWRTMLGCGAVMPSFLLVLTITVMPETPRWLVARGRVEEAREILVRLNGSDADLREIEAAVKREKALEVRGWAAVFRPPTAGAKRALAVGVGVAVVQQILAEESLLFYQPRILLDMGMKRNAVLGFLVLTGVLKTGCIVVAACYLDDKGRRPLLLLSLAGMGLSLFGVAVAFSAASHALAIVSVNAYMMTFSLGIGPITWLLASEVFPLNIRAKAMTLATVANRVTSTLIASTFLSWARAFTYAGYFYFFAALAAAVFALCHRHMPETKGKSLEEMAHFFDSLGEPDDAKERTVENPVFAARAAAAEDAPG